MALVKLIDEAKATGKVKAIFDDIKATKGIERVPNIWQALANHPDHLEVTWHKLKAIMRPGKLDLLTKEIIALAVSITNGCEY
jgi:alkylhydroperoxidase family enzyme